MWADMGYGWALYGLLYGPHVGCPHGAQVNLAIGFMWVPGGQPMWADMGYGWDHVGLIWATLWAPCGMPTWDPGKFGHWIHVGFRWAAHVG